MVEIEIVHYRFDEDDFELHAETDTDWECFDTLEDATQYLDDMCISYEQEGYSVVRRTEYEDGVESLSVYDRYTEHGHDAEYEMIWAFVK